MKANVAIIMHYIRCTEHCHMSIVHILNIHNPNIICRRCTCLPALCKHLQIVRECYKNDDGTRELVIGSSCGFKGIPDVENILVYAQFLCTVHVKQKNTANYWPVSGLRLCHVNVCNQLNLTLDCLHWPPSLMTNNGNLHECTRSARLSANDGSSSVHVSSAMKANARGL